MQTSLNIQFSCHSDEGRLSIKVTVTVTGGPMVLQPRKFQHNHRKKYKGIKEVWESSHIISAKELKAFGLEDCESNYRNSSFKRNRQIDTYIDNQLLNCSFEPKTLEDGTIVTWELARNRLRRKVKVLKLSEQENKSKAYNGYLMVFAKILNIDMRMFNGMTRDNRRNLSNV